MHKKAFFPIDSLQFDLTSHCNMRCEHCYNNSGVNTLESDYMTKEKWVDFSKYLVDKGGVYETILSGGEPFLLGDTVIEIMDILNKPGEGERRWFMLLTNGYFLTKARIAKLRRYRYHWLQISIDGVTAKYHDKFRHLEGGWEKAVSAAKEVAMSGIPLKIAHCVTPYNINDIDKMCEFAYSIGASEIIVGKISYSGRAAINKRFLLSKEEEAILSIKVQENKLKYSNHMIVKTSNSVKDGLLRHKANPRSYAVIRPNGDIRIDGMAPFVIGNILKEDFEEVWINKMDAAWKDPRVIKYIDGFNDEDINYSEVNYIARDVSL